MLREIPDRVIARRLGLLSWSTGIQFFSLMVLYATIADPNGLEIGFRQAPPLEVGILLGIILLADWAMNAYVLPPISFKGKRPQIALALSISFLGFSFLARTITVFSLLVNEVKISLDFVWLFWTAPLASMLFSAFIYLMSTAPIAYSRGRRLRLLSIINFTISLAMFSSAVVNYYIKPLDLDFWNLIVLIYSYKVGIMAIAFALEYDSWSTEIEKLSKFLEEE